MGILTRTTSKGYEVLCGEDTDTFLLENISKSWTNIITCGTSNVISLKNVSQNDLICFLDLNNKLYVVRKASISYLLKQLLKIENNKDDLLVDISQYNPTYGGFSVVDYNEKFSIKTVDKNGISTELNISEYLITVGDMVNSILSETVYTSVYQALIFGTTQLKNKLISILKNQYYNSNVMGTDSANIIKSGKGNDYIEALDGNDKIYASDGDDTVYCGAGDDTVYGGNGNDFIFGGSGDDKLYGDIGVNTFVFNTSDIGNDTIYSGKGEDILYFADLTYSADNIRYTYRGKDLIIEYGDIVTNEYCNSSITLSNYLKSPSKSSVKYFRFGDSEDLYDIYKEAELVFYGGDEISDKIYGTSINDRIYGGKYKDTLKGGAGDDCIYASSGADKIYGESGNDTLMGEDGDDTIWGGSGDDYIIAGTGNDKIYGGSGNNYACFKSGDGQDSLYLDKNGIVHLAFEDVTFSDIVFDRVGNNLIIQYTETDEVSVVNYFNTKNSLALMGKELTFSDGNILLSDIIVSGVLGENSCYSYNGSDDFNNLIITTTKKFAGVQTGSGNNTVILNSPFGSALCGNGNDVIHLKATGTVAISGAGNDTIYADYNNTTIDSGAGDDTIYINAAGSTVNLNSGTNTVFINKTAQIKSGSGNDSYYVKSLSFDTDIISNNPIFKDCIYINDSYYNINFLFDVMVNSDDNISDDDLFIISDKALKSVSKKGIHGVSVYNYFSSDENKYGTVYDKDGWYILAKDIAILRMKVVAWLKQQDYSTTAEVFASGNTTDIKLFTNLCKELSTQYWNNPSTFFV